MLCVPSDNLTYNINKITSLFKIISVDLKRVGEGDKDDIGDDEKRSLFVKRPDLYQRLLWCKGKIFIIEGIIGAGKTLLGASLSDFCNDNGIECVFLKEFVDQKLLDFWFAQTKGRAFWYQTVMLLKRIETYNMARQLIKH